MKVLRTIFWGLLLASVASADDFSLPPNLELVSGDSLAVTVREKDSGIEYTHLIEGGKVEFGPGWQIDRTSILAADTCYYFRRIAASRRIKDCEFGDADKDSVIEVLGRWGWYTFFCEYALQDSIFLCGDSLYDRLPMDYGGDADFDGKAELMVSEMYGMVLYEAPDSFSFPSDSVFIYPWQQGGPTIYPGGFTDLDGDGIQEITVCPHYGLYFDVLRNTGDNQYEHDYYITPPESLISNYISYIWGDLDEDGKSEVITPGSRGQVLCYENVLPDSFELVWVGHVIHWNSHQIVGPTDMDHDGKQEFVIMSNIDGGYFYYFFENTGDNSFACVDADSLPGFVLVGGGFGLWDFDGDGTDELAVNSNAWIGLYEAVGDDDVELTSLEYFPQTVDMYTIDINRNGLGEMAIEPPTEGLVFREYTPGRGIVGDINCDCEINLLDPLYLVNYLKGMTLWLPPGIYLADVNGTCQVNGVDVTYFVNYFHNGPALIDGNCR